MSIDELVVDDLDAGVVGRKTGNLVGNGLGIGKGRDVLADLREAEDDVPGVGSAQLGLGLLSEDDNVGILLASQQAAGGLAQTRVNTTAKTLVGAGNHEQRLLVFQGLGLGGFENSVRSLTVNTRLLHSLLSASQTGGSDNLHRVGDFLNVPDRLETALDFTKGGETSGIGRSRTE